jgi:hypothetical protein
MNLQDIFEMPELRNWTQDQLKWIKDSNTVMSFKSVDRLYDSLDEIIIRQGIPIFIFLNKAKHNCVAFIKEQNTNTNEIEFIMISCITFHYPTPVSNIPNLINPLQVKQVWTEPRFENQGIASFMYALLARQSFTVISDKVQYLGGKELWKSMAKKAHLNNYLIKIYNTDAGYIKDANGNILKYDSSNIDDSIIWKPNTLGQKTVLILTNR